MSEFPRMKGNARMAVGAGNFDVPLFSQITDKLWTGCSPAGFPDEHEDVGYDPYKSMFIRYQEPVRCHWLTTPIGHTPEIKIPRFQRILNLYPWAKYVVPEGTLVAMAELYDSHDEPDKEEIDRLAFRVIEWLEEGHTTLVHCQAGLNRSALVSARVIMLREGVGAIDAINLIRQKRSAICFCNQGFEQFLLGLDVPVLLGDN